MCYNKLVQSNRELDMLKLQIPGFPNYSVLSSGAVVRNGSDALRPGTTKHGYKVVVLRANGKSKTQYVHRLVALMIDVNIGTLDEVDHIDGDKSNNQLANLRIVTRSENQRHFHELKKGFSFTSSGGRICRHCATAKSEEEFISVAKGDGLSCYCDDCRKILNRNYYLEKVKR